MTLVEFLRARIAEDGLDALDASEIGRCSRMTASVKGGLIVDRSRVLAECEAKRRIVRHYESARDAKGGDLNAARQTEMACSYALKCLAVPYADHPDYREEWRP